MASRMSKMFSSKAKEFGSLSGNFDARCLTNSHLLARCGIVGDVLLVSYEQVQSLLAVATNKGIYVLGQNGVEVCYKIAAGHQAVHLQLHKSHLVVIDTRQTLYTWDLEQHSAEPVVTQSLRGVVTATYAEPSLDWLFLGMKDGTVLAWDMIAERLSATFKIKNQYFDRQEDWRLMGEAYAVPRYHISPVIQMSIHPTDLGLLLITYADGACLFSFKENIAKTFYECILSADGVAPEKKPALTCASFSPNGRFVVIGCIDGTMAFFDAKDGESPLQVRNMEMSDINLPRSAQNNAYASLYDPVVDIKWCCREDPDDTFLIIAGGLPSDVKGISLFDYGKMSTKTVEFPEYFATPQRQKILPLSRDPVVSLTLLGSVSPYYLAHNPRSLLVVNSAGIILVLDMPSGSATRSQSLPPALTCRYPLVSNFTTSALTRAMLSMLHNRYKHASITHPSLLLGGASRQRAAVQAQPGSILCTVHDGSLLRIFDMASDFIVDGPLLEIDLTLTMPNTFASMVTMSTSTGEFAVASESGLVVIYRITLPTNLDSDESFGFADLSLVEPMPTPIAEAQDMLFKFTKSQTDASIVHPICVVSARKGEVTACCVSDVGFVAIGYASGYLMLVDLRGPAIFYAAQCEGLDIKRRESVFKIASTPRVAQNEVEYPTTISFLSLAVDSRMSIVVLVGTSSGRIISFELLKEPSGVYTALLYNISTISGSSAVRSILGFNQFGEDICATGSHLSNMHMDADVADCVVAITDQEVVIYTGVSSKAGSALLRTKGKVESTSLIAMPEVDTFVLGIASQANAVEFFSLPDLQPLRVISFPSGLELAHPRVMSNGNVIFTEHETSLAVFNILGRGVKDSDQPQTALFDALKQPLLSRPTISNWAWVTGTQYVRASDLDALLSGGDRPLSKRAAEKLAAEEKQRALIERQTASRDKVANRAVQQAARNASGIDRNSGRNTYGQMQAYGQERGERVSHVNDLYENVSKASGEWLSEIDKLASNAKKSAGKAAIKSFLGF